ncbi:Glycoside hydrolase [Macleaya cordata]|uniref:Xyloglucan endotransglucosylase/hydrolase n=1 Tax=Macleaya cordata TaxID=56857 RepID=A0A200PZU1_MACCD|nr:Glycoside hydrolase [Macleaya cordata]
MAILKEEVLLFIGLFISCISIVLAARHRDPYTPPNLKHLTDLFPRQTFNQGFSEYFGGSNIKLKQNGSFVDLSLDKYTGSGFLSQNRYHYGFFSATMKLPSGSYTAGVVVAFYLSNADVYPRSHDEIDFELLGHANRKPWNLQTNVYGNGSVKYTGREEKFRLWFDPTKEFHTYTIIWNAHHIVFLVDNIPIREVTYTKSMSLAYPLKPMSLYSTLWDGSDWATDGGKYKVDYKYAPFITSFGQLQMEGCIFNNNQTKAPPPMPPGNVKGGTSSNIDPVEGEDVVKLSQEQKKGMEDVRKRFLIYSYCKDLKRYKVLPPECNDE